MTRKQLKILLDLLELFDLQTGNNTDWIKSKVIDILSAMIKEDLKNGTD